MDKSHNWSVLPGNESYCVRWPGYDLHWYWTRVHGPGLNLGRNLSRQTRCWSSPRLHLNPHTFSLVRTWLQISLTVPTTLAELWLQLGLWALNLSRYTQFVDCEIAADILPPVLRFTIIPLFIRSVWNTAEMYMRFAGFQLRHNDHWSDHKSASGRSNSRENFQNHILIIWSQVTYWIHAKVVRFKRQVIGGKTGPITTVGVFGIGKHAATVHIPLEPEVDPTYEFGIIVNATPWVTMRYFWHSVNTHRQKYNLNPISMLCI